ncbi:hypothetical protein L7F22_062747 [Adiantum nelumboides]|nr:hypothetical protein [Adiantum nelumboides]
MEVQNKGELFLKWVVDSRGSAVVEALQEASCIHNMTNKMRSNIVEDIDEEKKAMDELQNAEKWESEWTSPPFTICVLKWLLQDQSAYSKWNEHFFTIEEASWDIVAAVMGSCASRVVAAVIGSALQLALRKASKRLAQEILLLLDDELLEYFIMLVLQWFEKEPDDELIECINLLPAKVVFAHRKDVKIVAASLNKALKKRKFELAKEILLLLDPDVAFWIMTWLRWSRNTFFGDMIVMGWNFSKCL